MGQAVGAAEMVRPAEAAELARLAEQILQLCCTP